MVDVSGYNLVELPPSGAATALVLDDTAVVDLAPLGGWQRLARVSLRRLRPLSLTPIARARSVRLGHADADTLPALSELHALEDLRLEGTPLFDPGLLARCERLCSLELRHVPLETLRGIEALGGLARLSIEATSAPAGLAHLAALPALRELRIHVGSGFDVGQLPALPLLERIEVCGLDDRAIDVENIDRLARFPALRSAALRATSAATLSWLEPLAQLRSLDLAATEVADLAPLRGAARLEELNLMLVPAADLSPLAGLMALRSLDLSHVAAAVEPAVLASMSRLEELCLRGCALSGVLGELPRLAGLRVLDLSQTRVAELDGVGRLSALESLDLSGTEVSGLAPLGALPALRRLLLTGCPVSDLRPLTAASALEELALQATQVSSIAPLSRCDTLASLSLADLGISDLEPITRLARLRSLDLHTTRFADLPPLGQLRELRTLDLSGTGPSSLVPLLGLERLRELHVHHLVRPVDFAPMLALPPLALLKMSRTGIDRELAARLTARHHLVLADD